MVQIFNPVCHNTMSVRYKNYYLLPVELRLKASSTSRYSSWWSGLVELKLRVHNLLHPLYFKILAPPLVVTGVHTSFWAAAEAVPFVAFVGEHLALQPPLPAERVLHGALPQVGAILRDLLAHRPAHSRDGARTGALREEHTARHCLEVLVARAESAGDAVPTLGLLLRFHEVVREIGALVGQTLKALIMPDSHTPGCEQKQQIIKKFDFDFFFSSSSFFFYSSS